MAKLSKQELREVILADESLNEEVKGQLLALLKTPTFGLVWEEKTEDVIERLREELPILKEDKTKAIISDDPEAPNHVLIEADNLEALVALTYTHAEKFDAIYIDPPYNSGATDWRYNNDYVDRDDAYRHSKWLCMMEHRLKIAKKLLNPENSVLIATIDEKEYHHLGCLLEQIFPNSRIQMVSTIINPAGVARDKQFSRSDEYIYFIEIGACAPTPLPLDDEWYIKADSQFKSLYWRSLSRAGSNDSRHHSPGCFYPIFVFSDGSKIHSIGDSIPIGIDRNTVVPPEGTIAIWPLHSDGKEGCWMQSASNLRNLWEKGYVRLGGFTSRGMAIKYLNKKEIEKIESGLFDILGKREDGSIITDDTDAIRNILPTTQWRISSHNARSGGSEVLKEILGGKVFSFPKSVHAVHDALRFFIEEKTEALVLDFFAGSGTTMHATMKLNSEDGGHRQCFLVTNNENKICEEVTYVRNRKVILGYDKANGQHVDGLSSNSLRYYRVEHTPRKHTHENKIKLAQTMTEMLQIKWNAYREPEKLGSLRVKPKYMRYFEGDDDVLIIYIPEIIPYIVKEIKQMPEGKKLHVYVATDGSYAYSEEFSDVAKRIELAAIPSAYYNAIKSILPAPIEEQINYVPTEEDEEIIEQANINDYQD